MTLLETAPLHFTAEFGNRPRIEPTAEQIRYYVEVVKPRHNWADHLGRIATNHSNIVLGEE